MLTTSDPAQTRAAFAALGLPYEEHDPDAGLDRVGSRMSSGASPTAA